MFLPTCCAVSTIHEVIMTLLGFFFRLCSSYNTRNDYDSEAYDTLWGPSKYDSGRDPVGIQKWKGASGNYDRTYERRPAKDRDWNSRFTNLQRARWTQEEQPPIKKDFYNEHPAIGERSPVRAVLAIYNVN